MQPPTTARPEPVGASARSLPWRLALLVAGCLLAFAAAAHWLLIAPTGQRLAEARLEAAVSQARAEALLRLQEIEGQLNRARLREPAAGPQVDDPTGLAEGLATTDSAIIAVHRQGPDGLGLTLICGITFTQGGHAHGFYFSHTDYKDIKDVGYADYAYHA